MYSTSEIVSLRQGTLRKTLYVNLYDALYVKHSTSKNVSLRKYTLCKILYVVFYHSTSKSFLHLRKTLYVQIST